MALILSRYLTLICCFIVVCGETEWVWSKNQSPHISSSGNTNVGSNFGNAASSNIPQSPSRPTSFQQSQSTNTLNNNANNVLSPDSIRVANTQGEARLIPGALNFVSNALQGNNGGGGGGGGGGNGLISIGGGLLSSLLSNGPQIASSALSFLLGRQPSNNNNNNNIGNLPASGSLFPSSINTGGGGGGGGGSSGTNFPSSSPTNSGSCRCISLNLCFLPNRPSGSCDGGNVMCCETSSGTRALFDDTRDTRETNPNPTRAVKSPLDVRVGLLENIYRGSSTVFDDALDLVLQRWLTDEDKQKLATRVSNYNG